MYKNKSFLLVLSLFILAQFAISQNNTNSPYTRFGYGDISDNNNGEQRAMGGVAIGSRSTFSINTVNPASYSSVDSLTFMFDIGTSVLGSRFSDTNSSKTTYNSNLEYVTMQFPLSKSLGFSAGLLPYSFSGYNMYYVDSIKNKEKDNIAYSTSYKGLGGLSQVYAGISGNLFNHISLGVNAYYMYGHIYNTHSLRIGSSSDSTTFVNSITANNFRFRYGIQFYNTFAKKHVVTLGLIYENKAPLNRSFSQTIYGVITDTIPNNNKDLQLPSIYGIGLNYTYDKKISVGIDYSMQAWKDTKFGGDSTLLKNRSKLAIGLEYMPNPMGRKYFDRVRYRAGFNMSNSYFNVNGVNPQNYGITFGMGFPLRNSNTVVNASFEYGKIGSVSVLREDYFKFTLNAIFNEHWFFKRKL